MAPALGKNPEAETLSYFWVCPWLGQSLDGGGTGRGPGVRPVPTSLARLWRTGWVQGKSTAHGVWRLTAPSPAPSCPPVAVPPLPPSAFSVRNHPGGHRAVSRGQQRARGRQTANCEWKAAEQAWRWASGAAEGGGAERWGCRWGSCQGISREGTWPTRGITDEGGTRPPEAPGMLVGPPGRPRTPAGEPQADEQEWEAWHSGPAQ